MSTRSQIRFVQTRTYEDGDGNEQESHRAAQVYRHSDGYPSAVLPDLRALKRVLDMTGTQRDPGYVAANFIFLMKLRGLGFYAGDSLTMEDIESIILENDIDPFEKVDQPHFLLGYGIEEVGGIHGDEEYIYVVDIGESDIRSDDEPEWTVHVSEHSGFPRWDDDIGMAFDEASWDFVGPLEDALAAHA